ncbi:twin transmembrane helix small protein [Corynebacterium meitnerae]|uniref:Uncharacterized protein n=1 Tax=Corynebacterium meitnerae TaxID=2913498 RepID=A0A9X3LW37_9CORY|nr:hypothetical protein [Corynebacterium meitnerae]MCZ9294899.1 hypothetical protein [Corynebacterium meitnerae]
MSTPNPNPNPYGQPAGQWQQYQQPYQPPYEQPKKNQRPLIIAIVVALIAVIAVFAGLFAFIGGGDGGKVAKPKDVDKAFSHEMLRSCDLGDDFYSAAGWKDMTLQEDEDCEAFYETEEGDIRVELQVRAADNMSHGKPAPDGIVGWRQIVNTDGYENKCSMVSETPELEVVELWAPGPCELLHSMAIQLNNLVAQYRGEESDLAYMDPAPQKLSVASEMYATVADKAEPLGKTQAFESPDVLGSELTIKDVTLTPGDGDKYEVCFEGNLNTGEMKRKYQDFRAPRISLVAPQSPALNLIDPHPSKVEEKADLPFNGCETVGIPYRDADLLIVSSSWHSGGYYLDKAWAFNMKDATD